MLSGGFLAGCEWGLWKRIGRIMFGACVCVCAQQKNIKVKTATNVLYMKVIYIYIHKVSFCHYSAERII